LNPFRDAVAAAEDRPSNHVVFFKDIHPFMGAILLQTLPERKDAERDYFERVEKLFVSTVLLNMSWPNDRDFVSLLNNQRFVRDGCSVLALRLGLRGRLRSRRGSGERRYRRARSAVQEGATLPGGAPCGQRRAGPSSAISAPGRP
jgi:hypothetical protein